MPKTNAQKCKEYYYRKKAARDAEKLKEIIARRTGAECIRLNKQPKIMVAQGEQSSGYDILLTSLNSNVKKNISGLSSEAVTTSTNSNYFDGAMTSTNIAKQVGDNSLQSAGKDNCKFIISGVNAHHRTRRKNAAVEMPHSRPSRDKKKMQKSAVASSIYVLSKQDMMPDLERDISYNTFDFINHKTGLTVYTFVCENPFAHSPDLCDSIKGKSNVLLLNEMQLPNEESGYIKNYYCIMQYKRPNIRAAGLAMYQNICETTNILTPSIDMTVLQSEFTSSAVSTVGEFCVAECRMEDGKKMVIIIVYIVPNRTIDDIIYFLKQLVWPYTKVGGEFFGKGNEKMPMILSGDFNVVFSRKDARPLIEFFHNHVNLSICTSSLTDVVFTRYLNNLNTKILFYFI